MGSYKLIKPIKFGGETVTDLTYREDMEVDDLVAMEDAKSEMGKFRGLIASLCGVSPQLIGRMSLPDFAAMTGTVAPFLAGGPPTGKSPATTSSPPITGAPTKSAGSRRRSSVSGPPARRR